MIRQLDLGQPVKKQKTQRQKNSKTRIKYIVLKYAEYDNVMYLKCVGPNINF